MGDSQGGPAQRFGAFPAAEVLARLLEAHPDPALTKRVARLLQDFNEGLNALAQVDSRPIRQRLALLWRNDFLARAAFDPEVDKFLHNVIKTHHKSVL